MDKRISFIGTGAMGEAALKHLIGVGFVDADDALACDVYQHKLGEIQRKFNVRTSTLARRRGRNTCV